MKNCDEPGAPSASQPAQFRRQPERCAPPAVTVIDVVQDGGAIVIELLLADARAVRKNELNPPVGRRRGKKGRCKIVMTLQACRQCPRVVAYSIPATGSERNDLENRGYAFHAFHSVGCVPNEPRAVRNSSSVSLAILLQQ